LDHTTKYKIFWLSEKKIEKKNFFLYILAGFTTGFCQNTKLKNRGV